VTPGDDSFIAPPPPARCKFQRVVVPAICQIAATGQGSRDTRADQCQRHTAAALGVSFAAPEKEAGVIANGASSRPEITRLTKTELTSSEAGSVAIVMPPVVGCTG
jgi:hypothetical protein